MIFPLEHFDTKIAFMDGDTGEQFTYARCAGLQKQFKIFSSKSLIFLFCQNKPEDLIAYLAALNQGQAVCLLDARLDTHIKNDLMALYQPGYVIEAGANEPPGYHLVPSPLAALTIMAIDKPDASPKLHEDLALLLSTSGTTGSPKMIRLSKKNVISNAQSIIRYLKIDASEKAIASLPMHYSYGLSVIHTHLLSGATIVLTQRSVLQSDFWKIMQQQECTSFAGVPYTYAMLDRIGFDKIELPALKTMTQAGGHLEKALVEKFHALMAGKKGKFFVMYGQTEATARIAYLPPERLPAKAGAIGIPIPNGILKIYDEKKEIFSSRELGELVYEGPNVMLGYAEGPEDLAQGDCLHGVLHTGDLGYFDEDHLFYVKGRMKRISKVYGYRINLDEIETLLRPFGQVAALSDDEKIFLYFEGGNKDLFDACVQMLSETLKLHYSTFECRSIERLPLKASGKIDYHRL